MIDESLQAKIDLILSKMSPRTLKKAREALSTAYKEKNSSDPIFSDEARTGAYLGVRFPATFAAITDVLKHVPVYETLLDLGSGPATATLAANPKKSILIEKSPGAMALGKKLLDIPQKWICKDLNSIETLPKADLCIASYSIGEIKPLKPLLQKIWDSESKTIAIIEPGTPAGYETILQTREFFLRAGGHILAPCPHEKGCPLQGGNWCHFSVRLPRTKLQRFLKEGNLGYEDEKYSYLIVTREKKETLKGRVLRHPFKGSGFVKLNLCTPSGENVEQTVSRKEKDPYKRARRISWGDLF